MIELNRLKKIPRAIGLLVGIGVVGLSLSRLDDSDFHILVDPSLEWVEQQNKASIDIANVGISPSSDAWTLFEEFAKYFSLIAATESRSSLRDIPSIEKTKGGNRDELVLVLLHLFAWNGIDAEEVDIYGDQQVEPVGKVERVLVYACALDQYFDPTLPLAQQLKGYSRTLVAGKSRIHRPGPFAGAVRHCPGLTRGYYRR